MLLWLQLACVADTADETDGLPLVEGTWSVSAGTLAQDGEGLVLNTPDGPQVLAREVLESPVLSASGDRFAFVHRDDGHTVSVLTLGEWDRTWPAVDEGSPDRVAMSPDGEWVAFCSGLTGVASVYAMPFEGEPVQLTNVGLDWTPGVEPQGFVAPPHRGPLRFEGRRIVWTSPQGEHAVDLP